MRRMWGAPLVWSAARRSGHGGRPAVGGLLIESRRDPYDTDMTLDVDDVGALAVLHALADRGEADLLAVAYNEVHQDGVAVIDATGGLFEVVESGQGRLPNGYVWDLRPAWRTHFTPRRETGLYVRPLDDLMLSPPRGGSG